MPMINASALATEHLKGEDLGATISVILDRAEPGHGPRLRKHPYDETWVVIDGNLTFQAGDQQLAVGARGHRDPSRMPHTFTNTGPRRTNLVGIHANPTL